MSVSPGALEAVGETLLEVGQLVVGPITAEAAVTPAAEDAKCFGLCRLGLDLRGLGAVMSGKPRSSVAGLSDPPELPPQRAGPFLMR
jgi:hypothetical protein